MTPAQACSSFCPASQTKIYSGSTIDHSVGPDGKRYTELPTAFTFRDKIVAGCTCNGKDAFGLVTPSVDNDPTLRTGDIVATNTGMMAYSGSSTGQTPGRGVHADRILSGRAERRAPAALRDQDRSLGGQPRLRIKIVQPEVTASIPAVSKAKRAQNTPQPAPAQQQGWRPPWFW